MLFADSSLPSGCNNASVDGEGEGVGCFFVGSSSNNIASVLNLILEGERWECCNTVV